MLWQTKEQLTELLIKLVETPSITDSDSELRMAEVINNELKKLDYFNKYPQFLKVYSTENSRKFVTALVKKSEDIRKTVILVSHFDVVAIKDYGKWEEFAFNPEKLTEIFYNKKNEMPIAVQKDLAKGNWLFGRGIMDMKAGLTLHMSMLEQASQGLFEGNILLLTVNDEEGNSSGMRAAVPVLLDLAEKYNLEYTVCLNSEPIFGRFPNDENKYIYTGSMGKFNTGFLFYGKETHVGEPFSGLNANMMASQLTCELELNTDFCENIQGEISPPPSNLIQKGLKNEYSVKTPHNAVTLLNMFLMEKPVEEVIEQLLLSAERAAKRIEDYYQERAVNFARLNDSDNNTVKIRVLTYNDLMVYTVKTYGIEAVERIINSVIKNKLNKDDRDLTFEIVDRLAHLSQELTPMIVLFFAPPFYPAVSSYNNPAIKQVVQEIIEYTETNYNLELKEMKYYPGLSDLSYTGLQQPVSSLELVTLNMPLWGKGYSIPLNELKQLNVPVINVGPVGKDAHKWTERLDVDYAFETLKDMLTVTVNKIFAAK